MGGGEMFEYSQGLSATTINLACLLTEIQTGYLNNSQHRITCIHPLARMPQASHPLN